MPKSLNILTPILHLMIRAKIIVKGKVQRVRYRSKVKEIADNMDIVGEAENLKDDSVLIIAEGEKKVLNNFINQIKIKNRLIDVQDVSVDFEDATGEFTKFKKVISGTMLDVAERMDDAADHLEKLIRVVENGNKKTEEAGKKVDNLTTQTNHHFTDLKGSYHTFSERMLSMEEKLTQLVEYIGMLVKNHIEKEEKERKTDVGRF